MSEFGVFWMKCKDTKIEWGEEMLNKLKKENELTLKVIVF